MTDLNKSFTSKSPFKRILNATKYSFQGLKAAIQSEQAFRHDLILVTANTVAVLFFVKNPIWIAILLVLGIFVLMAELVNTAIEYVVDRISVERHPLSGKAKDVGSAIVFLAVINLGLAWAIYIAFPKI